MTTEIEARFLDIDKQSLVRKLIDVGAVDKGEVVLSEIIFYDQDHTWSHEGRLVRIRSDGNETNMTYKHHRARAIDSATEIEFAVPSQPLAVQFLEAIGLEAFRNQEKKRHTFLFGSVIVDIDTWPNVPAYVELEGPDEETIRLAANALGFDWSNAVFDDARSIIENRYGIPVGGLRWFTFDRVE